MSEGQNETQESPKTNLSDSQRAKIERNRQRALLLRQARLIKRPLPVAAGDSPEPKIKAPAKVIDSGGGFLIEEDTNKEKNETQIVHKPGPFIGTEHLICEECEKEFMESYLNTHFDELICDKCRDPEEKHKLTTKSDAKTRYLLKDVDFDRREPPLKFILKKNPRNERWGDMKLYLESQVAERAQVVWGDDEALEEAREQREVNKDKLKQRKFDKKIKELRMSVRSSLWTKDVGAHEHEYGTESYNEEEDEYSKTCKTCGHVMTYEKM